MGIRERLTELINQEGINNNQFYEITGLANGFLDKIGHQLRKSSIDKIKTSYPHWNVEYILKGVGDKYTDQIQAPLKNYDYKGSPYYNVDFIGGFDLVLEDKTINPEYFIDLPPYNKPDTLWCNLYGKSMEPYIFSGDRIAIKEVPIMDVIFGKVYGVITRGGLRTVKWIVRSPEKGCYRLVPENKDPKFGDYQDVKIEDIFKVFVVMGAVRAF